MTSYTMPYADYFLTPWGLFILARDGCESNTGLIYFLQCRVPAGSLSSFRQIGTGTFGIDGSAISNTAPLNISKDGSGSMAIKNVDVPSVNVISVG